MQKLNLKYKNKYALYAAEKGFCVLSREKRMPKESLLEPGICLIFYPAAFHPDTAFFQNTEQFCQRTKAKLLWIENPADPYTSWSFLAAADRSTLSIEVGVYHIHFGNLIQERDDALLFAGTFGIQPKTVFAMDTPGMLLDLSDSQGSLKFSFSGSGDLLTALEAGIRFYLPLPAETGQDTGQTHNFVSEIFSRGLVYKGTGVFTAVITPSALWNDTQTYILLADGIYESDLISVGNTVCLEPKNARLVLEKTAAIISYEKTSELYTCGGISCRFGIAGSFTVKENGLEKIILGLSGTEYLHSSREIIFVPHQNAILSNEPAKVPIGTSWIRFSGAYCSSSESMPFFKSVQDKKKNNFLRSYVPQAAEFQEYGPAVPVMFWNNIHFTDSAQAGQAEEHIRRIRYKLLTNSSGRQKNSKMYNTSQESFIAVTPCGVCVSITQSTNRWEWFGIAQTGSGMLPNIRLNAPTDQTIAALQAKDSILLVLNAEQFQSLGTEENQIVLPADGWEIILSQQYWKPGQTLLLFKYSSSASIRELLSDQPQFQYVLSLAFSGDNTVKPEYQTLLNILDDQEFQGILLLDVAALPKEVPMEVSILTSGIEDGEIRAVYTIIEQSRIQIEESGDVKVGRSRISSLFSYQGESIVNDSGKNQTLDCRTVGITVEVHQNAIQNFRSRMELLLAEWMGAKLTPADPEHGKCLVLNGTMTTIGGRTIYQSSLEGPAIFQMADTPVQKICFEEICMANSGQETGFLLSGWLSFCKTEGCDLFSFDNLPFSGMKIIRTEKTLYLDYSNMHFQQETAQVREHSFIHAFGASLSESFFCRKEESPDELGFSSITTPVQQAVMGSGWNGLCSHIPLGSSLLFEILTAWNHRKYYIGLRMPGALGNNFQLQGIIGAGFSGIELKRSEDKKTEGTLYFLVHGLTLKLLGISFPQNGAELLIFGQSGNIAWYAGYEEEK